MTPKFLALAKVSSVLGNICDVSWHFSKNGNELLKFSFLAKNGKHKNQAWIKPFVISGNIEEKLVFMFVELLTACFVVVMRFLQFDAF